jgi:ribonuclease T1
MVRRAIVGFFVAWMVVAAIPNGVHAGDPAALSIIESTGLLEPASLSTPADRLQSAREAQLERAAPRKAADLLAQLQARHGEPLPGYVGGREFQNRERRLPRGRYREYDVNPKVRGRSRDAERIVIEQKTGKAYYSGDHYRTFIPLN